MRAGELTERFRFEKRRDSSPEGDGFGNFEAEWQVQFTVAAKLRFRRGGEDVLAARLAGTQPAILTIRVSRQAWEIRSDWRCVNDRTGEAFNIREEPTLNRDRDGLEMLIERGVNSG